LQFGRFGPGSHADLVSLSQLSDTLNKFNILRDDNGSKRLDILGFCACAVSKAEFALELRDEVDYLVSSQVGISTLMTWPFDEVAQLVVRSPNVRPETLASQVVQCFEEFYEPPPVALTALDLRADASQSLKLQVDELAQRILAAMSVPGDLGKLNTLCVLNVFKKALAAYPYELEPLVDFYDLCRKLVEEEALDSTVRDCARDTLNEGSRKIVVSHARSGPKLGALHGISILAPDLDDPDLPTIIANCEKSGAWLWERKNWVEMVKKIHEFALANPEFV
jgi:hypothetical protein